MTIYVSDKLQATAATVSGDPTPTTLWQWLRNSSAISGATSSDYVVSADDVGANISVIQSAINMLGTAIAISASDGPVQAFTPSLLFRGSTAGTWYEPADMTTLFSDAAGTTPVTAVEQPVGLMLDKSKGLVLGPELVTNGDFSNGTTGWTVDNVDATHIITISGGVCRFQSGTTSPQLILRQTYSISAGKTYLVTLDVVSYTSGAIRVEVGGTIGSVSTGTGSKRFVITAGSGYNQFVITRNDVNVDLTIDNISVRELPGNHAFNSSGNSANFPVLSARYNLLTKTEQFDAWGGFQTSKVSNATTDPLGGLTADKVVATATAGYHSVSQGELNFASGVAYTVSVFAKASEYSRISIADGGNGAFSATFDLSAFTATTVTGVTSKINPIGNGWFQCFVTFTGVGAPSSVVVIVGYPTGATITNFGAQYTGDGTSGIYIWGADLRVANDGVNLPAYQRVNTSTDYDTVGFKPYLRFNGTNQWLQTNSIDFTYGDKMFVCAGVRKLSDAVLYAQVAELSPNPSTNAGVFNLMAPGSGGNCGYSSKGTLSSDLFTAVNSYPAPATSVLTGVSDIVNDVNKIRINGLEVASGLANQGTGNYGNYPLYIGARAGTSLWFNGRLYGMVVAGKLANAVEITETEKYVNGKTAAY